MREAVIIDAIRTPIGKRNGFLSGMRPDFMLAEVMSNLIIKNEISVELLDEIIIGHSPLIGEAASEMVKLAGISTGIPMHNLGAIISRQCRSSQQAVNLAAQAILSGDHDIVIATGVEFVSGFSKLLNKNVWKEINKQRVAAERIADIWGISRKHLDQYALNSRQRAFQAKKEGRFEKEILPLDLIQPNGKTIEVKHDSHLTKEYSIEDLSLIQPFFQENGKIHIGNSGKISDGAGAVLLMSNTRAEEMGLRPRFRILNRTVLGTDPSILYTGLIKGTNEALVNAGINIDQIDIFEINEDYASVPLIWLQETKADPSKLNPNGGAIALGHPVAATGIRMLSTMIHELDRISGRYGLMGVCEVNGIVNVTIVERI
ncbi:acetyl-CoA C-acyltransferase [Paenibacillus sp. BSR1-1]|uniref:acetyl-CoA C-acyltransferase n=1 Tax=Paenibacillus sp. BSR1-1 TaxID=3020845 RepID=UPI0025B26C04|nr:acetyl-CoA C-acyltransferase [Paenibacillus sp. BSR1-1]MDN3016184.1 acetyl-CoA C-acyltransferase [Paenibacillus sp. BSR1-1]